MGRHRSGVASGIFVCFDLFIFLATLLAILDVFVSIITNQEAALSDESSIVVTAAAAVL